MGHKSCGFQSFYRFYFSQSRLLFYRRTPKILDVPVVSVLFLFEGFYALVVFIVAEFWPNSGEVSMLHNIGCLILGIYVIVAFYRFKRNSFLPKKLMQRIKTTPNLKKLPTKLACQIKFCDIIY